MHKKRGQAELLQPPPACQFAFSAPVKRPIAADRDAVSVTAMWVVVVYRPMLRAAIVPQRNRVGFPVKTALEFGLLEVPQQVFEDRRPLIGRQADNARRKTAIDEQRLAAGHRVGAHDWVFGVRQLL